MTRPVVVVATRNAGKLRELRPMLEAAGFAPVDLLEAGVPESPEEEAVEAHDSFEANALAKARHFAALLPGRAILADDSGLSVDALGGAPGVRSKRWSGRTELSGPALDAANNAKLLQQMREVDDRSARFVCAAAWVDGERELVRRGEVRGRIVLEGGGSQGFGYDPYFWAEELGRTFGDSTREEKAAISHRARAVAAVLAALAGGEVENAGREPTPASGH
jgi:XTP/dITP diphosphohydrolase